MDLAVLDRPAQLPAEHHATLTLLAQRLGEVATFAPAAGLGLIEREVGILEQLVRA